jgi:hypothetical protein
MEKSQGNSLSSYLKQKCHAFFAKKEQEDKTGHVWVLEEGKYKKIVEAEYSGIIMYSYVKIEK